MAVIIELILYHVLDVDRGQHTSNLWITGHSLGGALASLVMARLQTIVDEQDPLVRWLTEDDKSLYTGSTVLYVMASQAIANFPAAYACENCEDCKDDKDWKNCSNCPNCRRLRSRERRRVTWTNKCNTCSTRWEEMWNAACRGCKNFMDTKADPTACEKSDGTSCFCGDCSQCDDCKNMKECEQCKKRRIVWPWILLRDCYTFASPKVGDTEFAKEFDKNQRKAFEKIVADRMKAKTEGDSSGRQLYSWPAYWRIANEFDLGKIAVVQNYRRLFFS
jgi:hypothetical protein